MNCKNCKTVLNPNDNFCSECGAKVVRERITIKSIFSNLLVALGWDSNFFITFRFLLSKPQIILKEYIDGTRKKYTNPFTFFAISIAVSLFVFNQYSEQFVQMLTPETTFQIEKSDILSSNNSKDELYKSFGYENETEFQKATMQFQLKYNNLLSFLLLPLYTLIAFLVFGKPFNYGEHLIINTYIQSITTFLALLIFIFSIAFEINIFGKGIYIITILYYSYAYKKLYEFTFGRILLKLFKFFGILILFAIIVFIIVFIIGVVFAIITK